MKKSTLNTSLAALAAASLFAGCTAKQSAPLSADTAKPPAVASIPTIARGNYLVMAMGCNDCHTPLKMGPQGPMPDMSRMLSGHPSEMQIARPAMLPTNWMAAADPTMTAWSGPWGVSFTANLTPDSATGIGAWTEDEFAQTMRSGRIKGTGRALLPPMPWQDFKNLTSADLASIYMYLESIPKISNQVPSPMPPLAAHAK